MISVLLPTIRPHLIGRALACLDAAAGEVPYEAVVVADFDRPAGFTQGQWIQQERRGVIDAVNIACAHARGDWWFLFNDESVLDPLALQKLHEAAAPALIVTPRHEPRFPFIYYGKPFAPFPFAHRGLIAALGGLLDPVYRGFYADPDFSLRAHEAGVPIVTVEDAVLRHSNRHDAAHQAMVNAYLQGDRAIFARRWAHLGELRDP